MKGILFFFVITYLLLFISESVLVNDTNKVYLLTHEWCRKCDKVIKIIQKIKKNVQKEENIKNQGYGSVKIQMIHFYHDFHQQKNVPQSHSQKSEQNNKLKMNDQNQLKLERIYNKIEDMHGLSKSEIPFPTIWIQCPYYTGFYQNQLTYSEVYYWIKLYCQGQIPNCPQKNLNKQNQQEDYHFQISSKDFEVNHSQFISFQLKNPFAKFCLSSQNMKQKYLLSQLKQQLQQKPLFCSHFNHNLRNYLYQSLSKLAVFLIFNNPSHPKIKQFIDIYKFISDSFHKKNIINLNEGKISRIFEPKQLHKIKLQSQYHHSSIQNYDFGSKKHIYQNLVFVGACYNENKRECIMKYEYNVELNKQKRQKDPSQKPIIENYKIPFSFVGSKTQNLKRILEFSHVQNIFQHKDSEEQKIKNSLVQIISFNFDNKTHQIETHIFQNTAVKLGNDFLFWVQKVYLQIFEKEQQNKSIEDKQFMDSKCLSSQIIHYLSVRNLTAIKNNVKISKYLQKINQGQQRLIKFKTIMIEEEPQNNLFNIKFSKNRWKSQYFQLCILNNPKKIIQSYEQMIKILQELNQLQKSKRFSIQIEMPTTNQL